MQRALTVGAAIVVGALDDALQSLPFELRFEQQLLGLQSTNLSRRQPSGKLDIFTLEASHPLLLFLDHVLQLGDAHLRLLEEVLDLLERSA